MKTILIITFLSLQTAFGFAQAIDISALQLLQKSWDKLSAMQHINYRVVKMDTMIRGSHLTVKRSQTDGTIVRNAFWNFHLDDSSEWLLRADTLYQKKTPESTVLTYKTSWDAHNIAAYSIHIILGTSRPVLRKSIISLKFEENASSSDYYIVKVTDKINYDSDELESRLRYYKYFIHKTTLLPARRIQYGEFVERGRVGIDIYDFSATIYDKEIPFNESNFFNLPLVREQDAFESLKIGSVAPAFKVLDVKTGKTVSLHAFRGKVVVLDFWYFSCMPCRTLMPKLQNLQKRFDTDKVVVLGINVKDNNINEIRQFIHEKKIDYQTFSKPEPSLISDYKLQAFPTTLVLDKHGKITFAEVGWSEKTIPSLEQAISKGLLMKDM
ncbi:MAG: TlpA family protein disulfide reductase [Pedobacter sp.]|nr:MAG: TlpA family protein disulfide reductase [Pedobacter sp.]